MKLNISYPLQNTQKVVEIDDDNKLRSFFDKRISHEVSGDPLGDDFKGYVFRISGGNDKQGFAMQQGVMSAGRVRLLVSKGSKSYRPRKRGERKRKSVRGCIVGADLSVLNLIIIKKGDKEIEGVTDKTNPIRLGPKRASKIRKLFNLSKEDDVRKAVVRRPIVKDGKKTVFKAPRIQRLITPQRLQHRRQLYAEKKRRWESTRKDAAAYNELVHKRFKEQREARAAAHAKNRSESRKLSEKVSEKKEITKAAPAAAAAASKKKDEKVKPAAATATTAAKTAPSKAAPTSSSSSSSSAPAKKPAKETEKKEKKDSKPAAAPPKK